MKTTKRMRWSQTELWFISHWRQNIGWEHFSPVWDYQKRTLQALRKLQQRSGLDRGHIRQ